jgi:hypothetical protein
MPRQSPSVECFIAWTTDYVLIGSEGTTNGRMAAFQLLLWLAEGMYGSDDDGHTALDELINPARNRMYT